jgi:hypothetical protein
MDKRSGTKYIRQERQMQNLHYAETGAGTEARFQSEHSSAAQNDNSDRPRLWSSATSLIASRYAVGRNGNPANYNTAIGDSAVGVNCYHIACKLLRDCM